MAESAVSAVTDQDVPDRDHMRKVLGHVPTSVCVVTTISGGSPVGSTVGSFTSVSLDPPLVGFFSQHTSDMLATVRDTGSFTINVLACDQEDVCGVFATKVPDRFDRIAWAPGPNGNPHLAGSLAVLECDVEAVTELGDHAMVLGRVTELDALRRGVHPLVFWDGALHAVATTPPDHPHHRTWLTS